MTGGVRAACDRCLCGGPSVGVAQVAVEQGAEPVGALELVDSRVRGGARPGVLPAHDPIDLGDRRYHRHARHREHHSRTGGGGDDARVRLGDLEDEVFADGVFGATVKPVACNSCGPRDDRSARRTGRSSSDSAHP